ncbi:MAG: InlB B-repeat-containing protein [Bacteroidales bacterium]|nr:InlB B-repeat-containing protein [Bacteroidales bacterium]
MKARTILFALGAMLLALGSYAQNGFTVSFDPGEGSPVSSQAVSPGSLVKAPAAPVREGWTFVGWYTDPGAEIRMWDFAHDKAIGNMTLHAKWVQLDPKHLLLNAYATPEELACPYIASSLQTLGAYDEAQATLTLPEGTTVYVAPGVYWTNQDYRLGFPFDDSGYVCTGSVGLTILGDNLSFIGLTGDAGDVRIAGNRGEGGARGLGAPGSWYTLALPTGFTGKNITVANYAQEDLVYPRDPSQNISKRIDSKNHAEVLRAAGRGVDKMYFDNCRFVGYLNMMAGFAPARGYFRNCFIQCTDDSIFGGGMVVYENCTFHLFDNHPTWGGGNAGGIMAVLGCKLVGMPQMTHPMLSFAKGASGTNGATASGIYAVIDCEFSGRIASVEWENKLRDYARYAVHNNVIGEDKQPLTISESMPRLSVEYDGEALKAFKVGDEYNVFNLLKGDDGWDPRGQNSAAWAPYANLPYRFLVSATGTVLYSDRKDDTNLVTLTPMPIPANSVDYTKVSWNYDKNLFEGRVDPRTGVLTLSAKPNTSGAIADAEVDCVLPNGIAAGVTLHVRPVPVEAPVLKSPAIKIGKGTVSVSYKTDKPAYRDVSKIDWYREKGPNTTDGIHIGTMMNDDAGLYMDDPFKDYPLSKYDVGCYLRAVITPKYEFSPYADGTVTLTTKRAITAKDVTATTLQTDFKNLFIGNAAPETVGRWFYDNDGSVPEPWTWGTGSNGSEGMWGLMNAYRDRERKYPRLVFGQTGSYGDMSFTVDYSPGKVEGQGFGGSGCYMDVYVKYDPVTRSGYGLRIERVPATTNGTQWTLYRYEGEELTPLSQSILTAAFMPQSTLTVSVKGNTLSVSASTRSVKTPLQIKEQLPEVVSMSWTDPSGRLAADNHGGFGIRMNNSGTPSYAYNALSNNCVMLHHVSAEAAER